MWLGRGGEEKGAEEVVGSWSPSTHFVYGCFKWFCFGVLCKFEWTCLACTNYVGIMIMTI